jgi:hypothetical protein
MRNATVAGARSGKDLGLEIECALAVVRAGNHSNRTKVIGGGRRCWCQTMLGDIILAAVAVAVGVGLVHELGDVVADIEDIKLVIKVAGPVTISFLLGSCTGTYVRRRLRRQKKMIAPMMARPPTVAAIAIPAMAPVLIPFFSAAFFAASALEIALSYPQSLMLETLCCS